MPNTLAHIGIQVVASRALLRTADLRWVLLGCLVPDVPWIANRALAFLQPELGAFAVRPYWIAQASLPGSLLLCGALAGLAKRPGRAFVLLAGNAFLHLLLDALQTKWGNGVHVLAPFSWYTWNAGMFWPESWPTLLLTLLGVGVAILAGVDVRRRAGPIEMPRRAAWLASAALFAGYCVFPLAVRDAIVAADVHSLQTLAYPELRPGREAGFDRVWLEVDDETGEAELHVLGGVVIRASGALPEHSSRVSARGRFSDAQTIVVEEVHVHGSFPRALASYVGLACVGLVLLGGVGRAREAPAAASSRIDKVSDTQRSHE